MHNLFASLILATATAGSAQTFAPVPVMPVGMFLDSLGTNVHLQYTDGDFRRAGDVLFELQYLGIRNVRNQVPESYWQPAGQGIDALHYLMGNGVHVDLLTDCNQPLADQQKQWDALAKLYPGAITAVESQNEVNNQPCTSGGGSSEQNAEQFTASLYSAVHGDSLLPNVPVYDFTGGAKTSTIAGRADFANSHPYPNNSRGTTVFARMVSDYNDYYGAKFPRVLTEDGLYSQPDGTDGVDEKVQAVGLLQVFFSAAALGIPHTYSYELMDAYAPGTPPYSTWGFFRTVTGEPKASATVMHNLTGMLNRLPLGPGGAASVSASITGATPDAHSVAMTDARGDVILWSFRDIIPWSVSKQAEAFPADVMTQQAIQGTFSSCTVYDALTSHYTTATRSTTGTYSVPLRTSPVALACFR